jgi:peptidoglycan/LPS O-acetylase OafA/YrhL
MQIPSLTALRFLAAAMIVLYHSNLSFPIDKRGFIASCALEQGVSFFFVLSGFILYYSYPLLESKRQVADFLSARFARVWPAHISAVLLFMALSADWWLPKGATVPWITLANVCMLQAWIPQSRAFFSLNAPSWSISVEWFFYLMFPFLVRDWSTTWRLKLAGSAAIAVVLFVVCTCLQSYGTHSSPLAVSHALLYVNPLARLFEFVLGMATALAFLKVRNTSLSGIKVSILEAAILGGVLLNLYLTPQMIAMTNNESAVPLLHWLRYASGAPLYAGLIAVIALQKGFISRLLTNRPMIFLGEISYSMYLLHWIILQYFVNHNIISTMPLWSGYALYWSCVLALSAFNFLAVERPCRSFLKKRLSTGFSKLIPEQPLPNIG